MIKCNTTYKIIYILLCIIWPVFFIGTVSYISTFAFLSLLGIVLSVIPKNIIQHDIVNRYTFLAVITAAFFVLNDYSLYVSGVFTDLIKGIAAFLIGTVVLKGLYDNADEVLNMRFVYFGRSYVPTMKTRLLLVAFLFPFIIDFIYLITYCYPGWVSHDTANQITQMMTGAYGNHHPYWHTKSMEMIIKPIIHISGNGNIAIFSFCVFQIVLFSFLSVYISVTLIDLGIHEKWIWTYIIGHSLMVYNIGMSVALVKDSLWSLAVAFFVVSMYRVFNRVDNNSKRDYIVIIVGLLGTCLYRTNGMIVSFVILLALYIQLLGGRMSEYAKLIMIMTVTFVVAFCANNIYIRYLGIEQPDMVESLSIPLQQIGRVSADNKTIDLEYKNYIDTIADYDKLGAVYDSMSSDSIKNYIREYGDQEHIVDNKFEFFKVWAGIGIRYPFNYIKAWVDETRGFWAPSYYYSCWDVGVTERDDLTAYGIHNVPHISIIESLWSGYMLLFTNNLIPFIEIFMSVGLRFWSLSFLIIWMCDKNRTNIVPIIVPIAIETTLFVATPVCHMFRYAYAIFTVWFFLVIASIAKTKKA